MCMCDIICRMDNRKRAATILLLFSLFWPFSSQSAAQDDTGKNLAKFAKDPDPWLRISANSEQRQPVYLGATPREIALRISPADGGRALMYDSLRTIGEIQARQVREGLIRSGAISKEDKAEFEVWPVEDERGQLTWAFARWRQERGRPWQRLNASILPEDDLKFAAGRRPVLPVTLDPARKADFSRIFDDVPDLKNLYDAPVFGDCVWMTSDGIVLDAWLPVEQRQAFGREVSDDLSKMGSSLMCRLLPQPARLGGRPVTFILRLEEDKAIWPENISWKKEDISLPEASSHDPIIKEWPGNFSGEYRKDVLIFAGEKEAASPAADRSATFSEKNNFVKDNSLQDIADYLAERYRAMGVKTWRQDFAWRGARQSNIIAIIPGTDPAQDPVVMAAHIDTPFCDDIFEKTGRRVPAPGADNDASGTAALLGAAEVLRGMKLPRTVWLAHLTGSELPADSLGARHLISTLLGDRKDLEGVILLDSIGRPYRQRAITINSGDVRGSLRMAALASEAARSAGLEPELRTRFNSRSCLYNTDGLVFSDSGFPVICLTGRENDPDNANPRLRGDSSDTSKNIDWDYSVRAAKAAIETAAAAASGAGKPLPAGTAEKPRPAWTIAVYAGIDESDLAKAYNPRLKELMNTPVPDNVELILERDADWPDGAARIVRTSSSHEELELAEKNSASPEALKNFLQWANRRAKGGRRLLMIQGSSLGWRGVIRDNTIPGSRGTSAVLALRDLARAVKESAFAPDVVIFDASALGTAEAIEELKDAAPYIIVSQLDIPYNGFPAAELFEMALRSGPALGRPGLSPREFAGWLPEAYVKEYARDGSMSEAENKYFVVTMSAVDTSKWRAFTARFRELAEALKKAGFGGLLAARPEWARAIIDGNNNVDIVEFLMRLPVLVEDPAVIGIAAGMLEMIGYPGDVAAENASTITIDPSNVRSFELRIETCPYLQKEKALDEIMLSWKKLNQDLGLPGTLKYSVSDFWEDKRPRREFIVKCPEGAIKEPITFRPWLAGAKYCVLTVVGRDGKPAERRFIKSDDFFSVKDFPETSFMISEAHNQGAPFIHGIGITIDPAVPQGKAPAPAAEGYGATLWNQATGWGELIEPDGKK